MPTQKIWDYIIDIKEGFVPKKEKVYPLSREEKRGARIHIRVTEERIHLTLKVTSNSTGVLCRKRRMIRRG